MADSRSALQKWLDRQDQRSKGAKLDTMNALSWNEWDADEMRELGNVRTRMTPQDDRRSLYTKADSVWNSWQDQYEQYHTDKEFGRDPGPRPPLWRAGDNAIPASRGQVFIDQARQDSTNQAKPTTIGGFNSLDQYTPTQIDSMSREYDYGNSRSIRDASYLDGGQQQALAQNGVVWIDGKKWRKHPYDPNQLEESD